MSLKDALPGQVMLMIAVALEELKASEAETDIAKIRVVISSVEATLAELHSIAATADEEANQSNGSDSSAA